MIAETGRGTWQGASATGAAVRDGSKARRLVMLLVGMILLGLLTFAAMLAFIELCDRV